MTQAMIQQLPPKPSPPLPSRATRRCAWLSWLLAESTWPRTTWPPPTQCSPRIVASERAGCDAPWQHWKQSSKAHLEGVVSSHQDLSALHSACLLAQAVIELLQPKPLQPLRSRAARHCTWLSGLLAESAWPCTTWPSPASVHRRLSPPDEPDATHFGHTLEAELSRTSWTTRAALSELDDSTSGILLAQTAIRLLWPKPLQPLCSCAARHRTWLSRLLAGSTWPRTIWPPLNQCPPQIVVSGRAGCDALWPHTGNRVAKNVLDDSRRPVRT